MNHEFYMQAAKSPDRRLTDRIIALLEAGIVPWAQSKAPLNLLTGKIYEPVNFCLLALSGYENPYFVTQSQAKKLGGYIPSFSKKKPYNIVVFEQQCYDINGRFCAREVASRVITTPKYYKVYNIAQTKNIPNFTPTPYIQKNSFEEVEKELRERCLPDFIDPEHWSSRSKLAYEIGMGFLNALHNKDVVTHNDDYKQEWITELKSNEKLFGKACNIASQIVGPLTRKPLNE